MTTAILITTYNRPSALARSLTQIAALGAPILVVDDGSLQWQKNEAICRNSDNHYTHTGYLRLPQNRGLAAAMNIGLSYWLADKSVEWISYFQDDVDVHPDLFGELERATNQFYEPVYTGHDSGDHPTLESKGDVKLKASCAGIHIHARRDFWQSIMPIPTYCLRAPRRAPDLVRGLGSNVDWWIVRDAPNSVAKRSGRVVCLPGLVRTFLHKAEDSSWGNAPRCGEDPPLRQIACS